MMTTLTFEIFEHLLSQEEGPALDFKRDQYVFYKNSHADTSVLLKSKSELLKDILAFANTKRETAAYILIGVEEVKGGRSRVVGVREHLDDAGLHQFVNSKTQRRVDFSYSPFPIGGYEIGVIEIPPVQERPVFLNKRFGKVAKGEVYIRDGSSTSVATPGEITEMSAAFSVKQEHRQEMSKVEFISQNHENIEIDDLFVLPHLVQDSEVIFGKTEKRLKALDELIDLKHALIRGEENSGKTTLCRKLFLHLVDEGQPALLIDLETVGNVKHVAEFFRKMYTSQFKGDYDLWIQKTNRTIIYDNLSAGDSDFVESAKEHFDNIFVSTSVDNYIAYFADDEKLAEFKQIRLLPLKHTQQEELIKKWKGLDPNIRSGQDKLTDGTIDQIEKDVNSIIFNRIVPRYPFFVLSILQTYEAFMPQGLRITAYGHCYHALIVAQLSKLGVASDDMDSCFNLLGWFAHAIRQSSSQPNIISVEDFELFRIQYQNRFLVKDSILNRLFGQRSPILSRVDGNVSFSSSYIYYFFLGRYLSEHYKENKETVTSMVEKSYVKDNSLALIFVVHHSSSQEILEEIILHTMDTLEGRQPVRLDLDEVEVFRGLLRKLPSDITTEESVEDVRKAERNQRDDLDKRDNNNHEESHHDLVNDIYKALKNMEVLSQILKNKYGSIGIEMLSEMIETVLETGLKLARVFLLDESEINEFADFLRGKHDEKEGITNLREGVRLLIFALVISSIGKSVSSIDKKEVSQIVESLCKKKNTPAYDLIQCLYSIDIADQFTVSHREMVELLLKKHRQNEFLERIISWRVQHYFNTHREWEPMTHRISDSVKQSTLALIRRSTQASRR